MAEKEGRGAEGAGIFEEGKEKWVKWLVFQGHGEGKKLTVQSTHGLQATRLQDCIGRQSCGGGGADKRSCCTEDLVPGASGRLLEEVS